METHAKDLRKVFHVTDQAGRSLKPSKSSFAKQAVELLGFQISGSGIARITATTCAIRNLSPPKDLKTLRSFLGTANYYLQCTQGYATVADPLLELTHKDTPF